MYTSPQMPQEALPEAPKQFPSLLSLSSSTLKTWKEGWGIFSLINLGTVLIGAITFSAIVSIMPWIKTVLTEGKEVDPSVIISHYPTATSLITDLSIVCAILSVFIVCILIAQIMTVLAINPEHRHKGLKYLFINSIKLTPKYLLTTGFAGLMVLGGTALLLIPGILLIPLGMAAVYVSILEQKSGMAAVVQGSQYVKGRVVDTLWRILVVILIIHAISLLLPFLATMLVYPFTLLDFSVRTIRVLSFIAGTLYTFISFVLSLIMPSLLLVFYFNIFSHLKDNPTAAKPLHPHMLKVLIWVGLALMISLLLLETFGV